MVDPQRNRVTGPEGEVSLQPKVIDLLCVLAERHGEVLSRAELIDTVWGREFGADESLTRAISQLRKAFGDTRDEPQVIETISKRGYRLIIAPELIGAEGSAPEKLNRRVSLSWIAAGAVALVLLAVAAALLSRPGSDELPPVRSDRTGIVVTVEPFVTEASLTDDRFADELAAAIARSPLVRARAQATPAESGTMQYRLRGTIRRTGDNLRVEAQLTDAEIGRASCRERVLVTV